MLFKTKINLKTKRVPVKSISHSTYKIPDIRLKPCSVIRGKFRALVRDVPFRGARGVYGVMDDNRFIGNGA